MEKARANGGRKEVRCGFMEEQKPKLEEIEASHTPGERGKFVSRGEGSGEGVDATLLSGTLYSIGLAEFATRARVRLWKTP